MRTKRKEEADIAKTPSSLDVDEWVGVSGGLFVRAFIFFCFQSLLPTCLAWVTPAPYYPREVFTLFFALLCAQTSLRRARMPRATALWEIKLVASIRAFFLNQTQPYPPPLGVGWGLV